MKCERCGVEPDDYDLHDYCIVCSKNLCDQCMSNGCCGNQPAISGLDNDSDDDLDDVGAAKGAG